MARWRAGLLAAGLCLGLSASATGQSARAIRLEVDAREAPRKIFHSKITMPAVPGKMRLFYPKWLPGNHGPRGVQRVGLACREHIWRQWLIEQLAKIEVLVNDAIRNSATRYDAHSGHYPEDGSVSDVVVGVAANSETRHCEPTVILV